jgi:hypothetical protein
MACLGPGALGWEAWLGGRGCFLFVRHLGSHLLDLHHVQGFLIYLFLLFLVLQVELRASYMLGKCSTTSHTPVPTFRVFWVFYYCFIL